jgi:hypothetical protein
MVLRSVYFMVTLEWKFEISQKKIQIIRLSIPITMRSLKWIGQGVLNLQCDIRKLRTPWPIHFKLRTVNGIDSLMVCILFGEISIFHSRVMRKKVFTNIVWMLTTGVSCALGAAVYPITMRRLKWIGQGVLKLECDMWNGQTDEQTDEQSDIGIP